MAKNSGICFRNRNILVGAAKNGNQGQGQRLRKPSRTSLNRGTGSGQPIQRDKGQYMTSRNIAIWVGGFASIALLFAQAPPTAPAGASGRGRGGGRGPQPTAWAPKPLHPAGWVAPMKPVWRLPEILAAHKGQANWTEPMVSDNYLDSEYISMGPG